MTTTTRANLQAFAIWLGTVTVLCVLRVAFIFATGY